MSRRKKQNKNQTKKQRPVKAGGPYYLDPGQYGHISDIRTASNGLAYGYISKQYVPADILENCYDVTTGEKISNPSGFYVVQDNNGKWRSASYSQHGADIKNLWQIYKPNEITVENPQGEVVTALPEAVAPEVIVYGKSNLPQSELDAMWNARYSEDSNQPSSGRVYSAYDPYNPTIQSNIQNNTWRTIGRKIWLDQQDAKVRATAPSSHPWQLLAGTVLPAAAAYGLVTAPVATVAGLTLYPYGNQVFNDIWAGLGSGGYVNNLTGERTFIVPHQLVPREQRGSTWDEMVENGLTKLGMDPENARTVAPFTNPGGMVVAGFGANAARPADAALTNFARTKGWSYTPSTHNFTPTAFTRGNATTSYPGTYNYRTNYSTSVPRGFTYSKVGDVNKEGMLGMAGSEFSRFLRTANPQEALLFGEDLVFDYLGSNRHIQQIMRSGVGRKQATDIARQMHDNAYRAKGSLVEPSQLKDSEWLGEYVPNLEWQKNYGLVFNPRYRIANDLYNEDIVGTVAHELGGHGATYGLTNNIIRNDYVEPLRRFFQSYQSVYNHNISLQPKVRPEFQRIPSEDVNSSIRYLSNPEEYSAIARSYQIYPDVKLLTDLRTFFTDESVDNLLNNVWSKVGDVNKEGVTSAMVKAYEDAVARGDRLEALKLLEQAYKLSGVPKTSITFNPDGSARGWYHGAQYGNHTIFNPDLGVTSTNGGMFAKGLGMFRGTHITSDLDAATGYATGGGSSIYVPTPEFLQPKTFMQKLANRFNLFKTRRLFPAENVSAELTLKPERTYEILDGPIINNLSKTDNVIYPLYINPGNNIRTIDFTGRSWSNSPIHFGSDYKVYEYLRDDANKTYRNNVLYYGPDRNKAYSIVDNHTWSQGEYGKPARAIEEKDFSYGQRQIRNDGPDWQSINIEEIRIPGNINGAVHDSHRSGYTSLFTPNIYDRAHSVPGFEPNTPLMDEVVVFKPTQLKLADITFDSNGRLIPLDKRFDWNNPSILYTKLGDVNREGIIASTSNIRNGVTRPITVAERLGMPKGVRNQLTLDQNLALEDLYQYITNSRYRRIPYWSQDQNKIVWNHRDPQGTTLLRALTDAGATSSYDWIRFKTSMNGLNGSLHYNPTTQQLLYSSNAFPKVEGLKWKPGLASVNGEGRNQTLRLTPPRVDADIDILDFLSSEDPELVSLGQRLYTELPTTISKATMRDFWTGTSMAQRPGTYLSGDVQAFPLGNNLISGYINNRTTGIYPDLTANSKPRYVRMGLSPDSYSSIIRQAQRPGNELRWGEGFTKWNDTAVANKHIFDAWNDFNSGKINIWQYKAIFDSWAQSIGGRPLDIKLINGKFYPVHPHPFIYRKKNGGKISEQ